MYTSKLSSRSPASQPASLESDKSSSVTSVALSAATPSRQKGDKPQAQGRGIARVVTKKRAHTVSYPINDFDEDDTEEEEFDFSVVQEEMPMAKRRRASPVKAPAKITEPNPRPKEKGDTMSLLDRAEKYEERRFKAQKRHRDQALFRSLDKHRYSGRWLINITPEEFIRRKEAKLEREMKKHRPSVPVPDLLDF